MSRLPIVILTWTLFAAVMLAIGWVLRQIVPPMMETAAIHTGWAPLAYGIVLLGVIGLVFSLWPRDGAGRLKSISTRR